MISIEEHLLNEEIANMTGDAVQMVDKPLGQGKVMKRGTFAGADVFDVSDKTYCNCTQGKKPYTRWKNFIDDEDVASAVRDRVRNSKRPVIIRNSQTKVMTYVKK